LSDPSEFQLLGMSSDHPFARATFMMYRRTLARSSGVLGLARPTAAIAADNELLGPLRELIG
jgi:hypothetical protein